ncbi:hypothetical protein [Thermaerobacillus caldiproteolyticus]|uniref:hypothetical protein n=1 Tax=Thermaerobacillus caldiproteolyticus TaxID=247480 RepID=UPI00188DA362|nr:hypothetical protein [Anoxybacillus caldiproteolyticus]QPA30755.1 hypothetical protein ISX45_14460 [Anoxybacillus caldiproteolyticus]
MEIIGMKRNQRDDQNHNESDGKRDNEADTADDKNRTGNRKQGSYEAIVIGEDSESNGSHSSPSSIFRYTRKFIVWTCFEIVRGC